MSDYDLFNKFHDCFLNLESVFNFMKIAKHSNDVIVNTKLYKTDRFGPKLFHSKPIIKLANKKENPATK